MTIKQVMGFGCKGFTKAQKETELERRLKVVERINKIGEKMERLNASINALPAGSQEKKVFNQRKRELTNTLRKIKGDENVWLKEAAWFMYV